MSDHPHSSPVPQPPRRRLAAGVEHVIPVASGKGGVGKSTVSVNLALALAGFGRRVGLMDADVYGPSIPLIMGIEDQPRAAEGNRLLPPVKHGVPVISMAFFVEPDQALIWRGPMLAKMVDQFLGDVEWGALDYLIVDLPPGTGDIQLTLCQIIPLTGAVVVSTPQDAALQVASRAVFMFRKLNCPVIGVVENMSHYLCPHCGARDEIFGSGGCRQAASRLDIPFLGEIPLATSVRIDSDRGSPTVVSRPDSPHAAAFTALARRLEEEVTRLGKEAAQPRITF